MKSIDRWKVGFGGLNKTELLGLLSDNKICLNAYSAQLFMDDEFVTTASNKIAEVVGISVKELGFNSGARYHDIVAASSSQGLP